MAALMRNTGEEIEADCRVVRDVTASQKTKRETIIKFEELFEKWEKSEPVEQIQAEHTFGVLVQPQQNFKDNCCILKSGTSGLKLPCDISQF